MSKITDVEILSKNVFEKHLNVNYNYEIFHENTKLNKLKEKILGRRISGVLSDPNFVNTVSYSQKISISRNRVYLPKNYETKLTIKTNFRDIVFNRRSNREFSQKPINIYELTYILNMSYGVNGSIEDMKRNFYQELRVSPSSGGLYPLEIYVYANNIENIDVGIYHFSIWDNSLEVIKKGKLDLDTLTSYSDIAATSGAIVFILGVFPRLSHKYGERSYRFIHLDAGHLGQNLYLSAESIGLGAVAIGGFFDDEINELLNVDGTTEGVLYEFFIGNKRG